MLSIIRSTARLGAAVLPVAFFAACGGGDQAQTDTGMSAATGTTTGATAAGVVGTTTAAQPAAPVGQGTFLDPGQASREQLMSIPGVDSATAAAIIAGRPYQDMRAVDKVLSGRNLTEQQRDTIYTRLWMPLDLNTATGEEIVLIPGVGARMRREFLEYRPYRSMEQFRREIGKYVDDKELARLERYVTIRNP